MIRTYQRVEIDGKPVFVLCDDDAIDLAHALADGFAATAGDIYMEMLQGNVTYQGHRVVVQE